MAVVTTTDPATTLVSATSSVSTSARVAKEPRMSLLKREKDVALEDNKLKSRPSNVSVTYMDAKETMSDRARSEE